MNLARSLALVAGVGSLALGALPAQGQDGPSPPGARDELRRSFTLGGLPVPPLVFRDLGDGNAADNKPMLVAVDAWAAIGSNQYGDAVQIHDGSVSQTTMAADGGKGTETETYRYLGATSAGLMVLVTKHSASEANYAPTSLHVLDAAVTRAFDADGKLYDRVVLTVLADYPLGDRWQGRATLGDDTVTIVTEGGAMRPPGSAENTRTYGIVRP